MATLITVTDIPLQKTCCSVLHSCCKPVFVLHPCCNISKSGKIFPCKPNKFQSLFTILEQRNSRSAKKNPQNDLFMGVLGIFPFLVDPRRVELLSESPFTKPSPWAVCYLEFPSVSDTRQPLTSGSPFLHDRYKCELSVHVHHSMTLKPKPWYSMAERAAYSRVSCLGSQCDVFVSV